MKHFTPFVALGFLAAASMPVAAQASFEKSEAEFWTTHRTSPYMADFTNTDNLDIIYGGQGNALFNPIGWWWQIQQNLCLNNGDGTFSIDGYSYSERQGTNEETGEPQTFYDRVYSNHGIIGSTYNQYAAIDYNNDGLLDILLFGRYEWDIFLDDDQKQLDRYLLLYKNLGNGKFELVTEAAFPKMKPDNDSVNYSLAVGDYDRDGYVDFIVSATDLERQENYPGRTVSLYRNLNGTGAFQDMKIAETKGGVYTDEKKDDSGSVIVEKKLLEGYFLPVSGGVHFADINNDGWLDIVYDGWADNNWDGIHGAGNTAKVYLNQNGQKFVDVTPDTPAFVSLRSSASNIVDFDKDGNLDFFQTGWGDNGYNWNAFLFYNNGDGETFFEEPLTCDALGLDGTEKCRQIVRDFNGDGYLDIYYSGATNCHVYYGDMTGSFTKSESSFAPYHDGYAAAGDINKNGLSDIFVTGYGDNGAMAELYLNSGDAVEAPVAPTNVDAEVLDGQLIISWEYDTDAAIEESLVYNIYVKKADGSIYALVPANPETGFVKVGEGRVVGLRPQIKQYTLPAIDGEYTIGVQVISTANETYSPFVTKSITVSGIAALGVDDVDAPVCYYNAQGIRVDNPAKGQLLIKVQGNNATKIVY